MSINHKSRKWLSKQNTFYFLDDRLAARSLVNGVKVVVDIFILWMIK